MKRLALKQTFCNEFGNEVSELSLDTSSPEMVMAALQYLKKDCVLTLTVYEKEVDDSNVVLR